MPSPRIVGRALPVSLSWTILALAAATAARADYADTVQSDAPQAYYRLNDSLVRENINHNSGAIGSQGNATNLNVRPFPGAIAGDANRSQFFGSTARSIIPWTAALNPTNTRPFTVEAWMYPASDQINGGQAALMNRYSYSGVNRQGWVVFQRAPNSSYAGTPGYEGVGWNFRMYRGSGGSSGLDVVSGTPYEVGKWAHLAVVYDPVQVTNATLTMFINGVPAATNVWSGGPGGTDPGYVANTDDHDPAVAVNGPSGLGLGSYNNTDPGANPYFGAIDELAFYSSKLAPAQILEHYQNGTNAGRATPYSALVDSQAPAAHLRMDELVPGADLAINLGDLRADGNGTHTAEVHHPAPGALAGRPEDASAVYHFRNGKSTTTIPWKARNNPNAGTPFTFEAWVKPGSDRQGGQCPFNNRWVGGTGRTGWVVFQRNPNLTYPASEGHGWNFRMYSGSGGGGQDVLTGTDYAIGRWQHLVFTWQPQIHNGDTAANGNDQWAGVLTAYVDGVAVATNASALYAANANPPEDAGLPADFGIGSYNAKSGLGDNPYEGAIDEVAIYDNYVLTPEQIASHHASGTGSRSATNYETLVLTAESNGIGTQRLIPATYLRFNEPALNPVANSGTLVDKADASLVVATNAAAGPVGAGFESTNRAVQLDGLKGWISVNNPAGLNLSNRITLEAWIKPDAAQNALARIVSHGPPTLSSFLGAASPATNASVVVGSEVFLRIDGSGLNYSVGSSDGTNTYGASFPVPAGDLGGTNWIHLAGTYDGTTWRLYRNGALVASAATPVGALPVDNGGWAIGSTGNGWENLFAGGIDEVAIYDQALSAARIGAHYAVGQFGPHPISITRSGGNVTVGFPAGGTLQESPGIGSAFTPVSGAAPPSYTTPANSAQKFYRVQF